MKKLNFALVIVLSFVLIRCQSTPPAAAPQAGPLASETHLDFARWNRGPDCCVAKGTKYGLAASTASAGPAAAEIFKRGGNVVDAAVATAFAITVERGYAATIGGGGFMTVHFSDPAKGDVFVDFRETAPGRATKEMFLDQDGNPVPNLSLEGGKAVAVPGFVAGLYDVHKKWGKLPWKTCLEYSIKLARNGFEIYPWMAQWIGKRKDALIKDAYLKKQLFKGEEPLVEGDKLVQKDLSRTLGIIASQGKKVFYSGPVAQKIILAVKARGGVMELSDLKNYETKFRAPLRSSFADYEVVSAPPPSAGGILLTEILHAMSNVDLAKESADPARYSHLYAEVFRRAYADRSVYVADPGFYTVDYSQLLTPEYGARIRESISLNKATPSKEILPGMNLRPKAGGTAHFSIIDAEGNAISATISSNGPFGASTAVPGTGIWLNNTMDDFAMKPGEKNLWGLVSNEGNLIAPGKRPNSSMMPTIILNKRTGKPILAIGATGGSRIISSTAQVALGTLKIYNYDLKKALFAPRVHHQWQPDKLEVEGVIFDSNQEELKRMGHETVKMQMPALPLVQAVVAHPDTGEIQAVFDPRAEGAAIAQ